MDQHQVVIVLEKLIVIERLYKLRHARMDNFGENFRFVSVCPQDPLDLYCVIADRVAVTKGCNKLMCFHGKIKNRKLKIKIAKNNI